MSAASDPGLLAMDMAAALAGLAAEGRKVRIEPGARYHVRFRLRIEPAAPPKGAGAVARWRVARVSGRGDETVLVVVPEIEGRIECGNLTPNQ